MPRAQRGGRAKGLALQADPNAQLVQEPPVGTTAQLLSVDPTTQLDDDLTVGLADLGLTGPAGMVKSWFWFLSVDVC